MVGGGSRRFGIEKPFFLLDGKPMIQHVIERLTPLSIEFVISSRSRLPELARMFPYARVIPDKWSKRGALTGLMSSLPVIRSEYVGVVTCDCPKVNPGIIKQLFRSAENHDASIPIWPNGYIEPLQAVYMTGKLKNAVKSAWDSGEMRLRRVTERLQDVVYIPVVKLRKADPTLESFWNINSPSEVFQKRGGNPRLNIKKFFNPLSCKKRGKG